MTSLFLAWQSPDSRMWFPVGRLDADVDRSNYLFQYVRGALEARDRGGFRPLVSFPDLTKRYESDQLFSLFRNRVLDEHRRGFHDYLSSLALDRNDPIAILAITGGERQTDSFEVFPKIEKATDGSFSCRFFLHGLRHLSTELQRRAALLQPGESLGVSVELTNPATGVSIQLTTRDYSFVGWAPKYLVHDLLRAIASGPEIGAKVIRVNSPDVPANRRVLVEFSGHLPADVEPMSDEQFLPLVDANVLH